MIREYLDLTASLATAAAVIVACWQLAEAKKQARLQFEDHFNEQYRALIQRNPLMALLGERLTEEEHAASLPEFYHYFDLSNEQAFLHECWTHLKGGVAELEGRHSAKHE